MQYIEQIDAFGVPISLTHKKERQFRSVYGGLATLVLYSVCMAYAIYILYLWYVGQILPKVQNQVSTIKDSGVYIEDLLSLGEIQSNYTSDPFSQSSNIILPILVTFELGKAKFQPYFSTIQHVGQTRPLVNIKEIDLVNSVGDPYNMSSLQSSMTDQKLILLVKCNQTVLGDAGTCAPQLTIDEYFNKSQIMFDLSIKLKSYNSDSKVFEEFYKTQYIPVDLINIVYSQLYIQTTNIQIDTGLLFQSIESQILMNNYNIFGITVSNEYIYFEGITDILTILQFRVDNYQNNQTIVYPKIGEVFAQIGSIITALLSLKFLFQMLNQSIFEQNLVDEVLSLVYDDYKNIRIKYNILGRIKNASLNDQFYEEKSFQEFHYDAFIRIQQFMNLSCQISQWIKLQHFLEKNKSDHLIMPVRLKNSFSKVFPEQEVIKMQQNDGQQHYDLVKIETPN